MALYEEKTGGSVLAIPHNDNLSNGLMFAVEKLNGRSIDRQYAETRMRWEPIVEVTQIKGDGVAHPYLSPEDEWADYGTWDKGDIEGVKPKLDNMLQYEYARSALQIGLQQEQPIGANPFKFGMIEASDSHTGLASTRDENYWGKFAGTEPAPVFLVGALKDPWAGNLDRIQIIKGWVDENGKRYEQIYDVAVADGREISPGGRCKTPIGNTVDEKNATYLNNIGDAELRAVWTDPNFNPNHRAVYYTRVLEIPKFTKNEGKAHEDCKLYW